MLRPKVHSISQLYNYRLDLGVSTTQYKIRVFCVNIFVRDKFHFPYHTTTRSTDDAGKIYNVN